MRKTEMCIAW